jgi:trehalose utilization protein
MTKVTIWNEFQHERENEVVKGLYPQGIHHTIAEALKNLGDFEVQTATLDEPEHGLSDEVLAATEVLIWWGHKSHGAVHDAVVEKVHQQVLSGMGLVVLHSGHFSKIFKKLHGTHCSLKWREADEKERLWNIMPSHPIMAGIPDYFELEQAEMYGEPFAIPTPDELLMISWFQGGEVFRSLATWQKGHGKLVYFRPGHETYPIFHNQFVQRIIANSCAWAKRRVNIDSERAPMSAAIEPVPNEEKEAIL